LFADPLEDIETKLKPYVAEGCFATLSELTRRRERLLLPGRLRALYEREFRFY
jgi:hypothetical protein